MISISIKSKQSAFLKYKTSIVHLIKYVKVIRGSLTV